MHGFLELVSFYIVFYKKKIIKGTCENVLVVSKNNMYIFILVCQQNFLTPGI